MVLESDIKKFYDFFRHEHKTEIRVFDEKKYPEGKSIFVNDYNEFIEAVEKYQKEKVDVFIGFRDRRAKGDKNVMSSSCIFFEIDEHDIKKPLEKQKVETFLKKHKIEAGMVGLSGGGFHFYIPHKTKYFFNEEDRIHYKKLLDAFKESMLSEDIDIDPVVFNLERVSRVLGTMNLKRDAQSKILDYNEKINVNKNHASIRELVLRHEKKEVVIDKNAIELLEKYNFNKTDKWLYELIKNKIKVGNDTGGNSIVFKNVAIILSRESLLNEEVKIIGKAVSDLCDGRTLSAFMGWYKKAKNNEIGEVNEKEIDNFIQEGKYNLTQYAFAEKPKPIECVGLPLRTYEDFKKLKKNKNYIVEDFLYPETIVMAHGSPACFKSLLYESLGMCVSNGKQWLGFKTKKAPVLYLDGENSDQNIKERLMSFHKGMNLKRNKFPFYILKGGVLIDQRKNINIGFLASLEREIEEKGIKVLIFDTMHRFAFYDENKSDDINLLYTKVFKPLVEEYKIAIVFLHHSTKAGDYRGSGDFLGSVDVAYKILRKGKTNNFTIINEKCRSGEIENISGEIDFGEDYIKIHRRNNEEEEDNKIKKLKEVTERIHSLVEIGVEVRKKEIIEMLEMQEFVFGSVKTIERSLKFLCDTGKFDKTKHGVYRRLI